MTNTGKFIVFIMLVVIAGLVYLLVRQVNAPETTVTPTPTVEPTEETADTVTPTSEPTTTTAAPTATTAVVASVTPPAGWKEVVNDIQVYTAYRPGNWWFRFFPPSKQLLGIDPNPIPEVGEYAGAITIVRLSGAATFNDWKEGLEAGFTETPTTINGRVWTIVKGKQSETGDFPNPYVKYGYVEVGSKQFVAGLTSGAANYNGYESIFDTFISVLVFN